MTTDKARVAEPAGAAGADGWTVDRVRRLGLTTDVETAGAVMGIGRSKAYELAKAGQFPVKVLRIGRRYLVSVPAILKMFDVDPSNPGDHA